MNDFKTDILSLEFDELESEILKLGEAKFRAAQIFSWLHEKRAKSFDEMTNLS
ncbi:MAG: 23S rRNA (adenine(2503)-C(2))-methyltransferase RlmN, partial [Ruminococcus sp.]|nr:23S rRNA (adenine(2503)-C(2))-methyltransferase RlmN [Ruminococcus sp.]